MHSTKAFTLKWALYVIILLSFIGRSYAQFYGWNTYSFPAQDAIGWTVLIGSDAYYLIFRSNDTVGIAKLDTATFTPQWVNMLHNNTARNWYRGAVIVNDTIVFITWRSGGDDMMQWLVDGQTGSFLGSQIWSGGDIQPGAIALYPDGTVLMSTEQLTPWATIVRHRISSMFTTNSYVSKGWRIDNCGHMRMVHALAIHSFGSNPDIYSAAVCEFSQWGIARLSDSLDLRWAISLTIPGQGSVVDAFVAWRLVQINDRVLMLGRVQRSAHGVGNGPSDVFVIAVDTNGNFLWARTYGGPGREDYFDMLINPVNPNEVLISMASERANGVFAGLVFSIDINTGLVVNDSAIVLIDTLTNVLPLDMEYVPNKGIFIAGQLYGTTLALGVFPEDILSMDWCVQKVPIVSAPVSMTVSNVADAGGGLTPSSVTPNVWTKTLSHDTFCVQACVVRIDSVKNVLCNGDSSGSAFASILTPSTSFQVQWSNGDTGLIGDSLSAGSYWVALITSQCSDTAFFTITEPPPLVINSIDSFAPTLCVPPNGWIMVDVSGGTPPYTHTWNMGYIGDSIYGLSGGIYIDTISDSNGCVVIARVKLDSAEAMFSVNMETECIEAEPLQLKVTSVFSGGSPPFSVYWEHITDTARTVILSEGQYPFVAFDSTNCTITDTLFIRSLSPKPFIDILPPIDSAFMGDTVVLALNSNNMVQWTWGYGNSSSSEQSIIVVSDTVIYVFAKDSLGCVYKDSALIYMLPSRVYFPTIFSPNNDGIHDVLKPVMYGYVPLKWKIYNRWGQLIFEGDEFSAWDGTVNGTPVEPDRYVLIYWILDPVTKESLEKRTMSLYVIR